LFLTEQGGIIRVRFGKVGLGQVCYVKLG
jgi:hypothetical protein